MEDEENFRMFNQRKAKQRKNKKKLFFNVKYAEPPPQKKVIRTEKIGERK